MYAPPTPPPEAANVGDVVGFIAVVVVFLFALAVGFLSLVRWSNRSRVGDSFADDFIPDRVDVAATEAHLPKFGDVR